MTRAAAVAYLEEECAKLDRRAEEVMQLADKPGVALLATIGGARAAYVRAIEVIKDIEVEEAKVDRGRTPDVRVRPDGSLRLGSRSLPRRKNGDGVEDGSSG